MPNIVSTALTHRGSGSTLHLRGDYLVKTQHPEHSRVERERTLRGARIAADCGLFDVPEILSFNDAKGEITFRFVSDAVPLRTHLVARRETELVRRVGQALAAIHETDISSNGSDVFWHGDFGLTNILYSPSRDRITVVDWANAAWALEPVERSWGDAGFDLGVFLVSVFHHRLMGPSYVAKPEQLCVAFLEAYAGHRHAFHMDAAYPVFLDLLHLRSRHWRKHGLFRTVAYSAALFRLRIFVTAVRRRLQ